MGRKENAQLQDLRVAFPQKTAVARQLRISSGPLVVTSHGQPVAALVPIENADMETVALSTNPEFLALIERSRARARAEGGIASEEMRRRFEP